MNIDTPIQAILVVMGGFLLLLTIIISTFFIYLSRRKSVKAHFIYGDNSIKSKRYKNVKDKIEYKDSTYIYDHQFVIKKLFAHHIYYFVESPNPIDFSKRPSPQTSSKDLKSILESDIIQKIFGKRDMLESVSSILILITLLVSVLTLVMLGISVFGGNDVTLANNDVNKEIIKQMVESALRG